MSINLNYVAWENRFKGRIIRKVMGGGGGEGEFSSRRNFFSLSNSLYDFFLGHSMNIFLGLIGVHEFFFI